MSDADMLAGIWLFADASKEDLEKLATFAFTKSFAPGEVIIEEGRTGNGLYVIASGQVEVIKGLKTEQPKVIGNLGAGEFFGEMALLGEWPRSASVRTLGDTVRIGIDRWLFLAQIWKQPHMAIAMLQVMAERLRLTGSRLAE